MPTYISLLNWTDQGIKSARESPERVERARQIIEGLGGQLVGAYWTQGAYDLVGIFEFPDDETATAWLLGLGMQGNVRSETLRAFSAEEMQRILQKVPQG